MTWHMFILFSLVVLFLLNINAINAQFNPIQKLVGGKPAGASGMGFSVAISKDGSTAIIGGPFDRSNATGPPNNGAIWVFERLGNGTWVQQGEKLSVPFPNNVTGFFGTSVALSGDGNTALIGAQGDDNMTGSVWFFNRLPNKTWVQRGDRFQGSDFQGLPRMGFAVAMDPAAKTAFVGGIDDHSNVGAVWVVINNDQGDWVQAGPKLVPSDVGGAQAKFGSSVVVSDDLRVLVIGGPADNLGMGAAWIFFRDEGGPYIQSQAKLVPSDATITGQFGSKVALSADGSTVLISSPMDSPGFSGAAWVFIRQQNGMFVQQTMKLVPLDITGAPPIRVGSAVAISSDGYTAFIGATGDNNNAGAVWVFCRYTNDSWIQHGPKLIGPNPILAAQQGFALSYASDPLILISGGQTDNNGTGAAWLFGAPFPSCPGPPPTESPSSAPTLSPSSSPSLSPSLAPSGAPSLAPSFNPSATPTFSPSASPTFSPSFSPSSTPSFSPTTSVPSASPVTPSPTTGAPTVSPSWAPTTIAGEGKLVVRGFGDSSNVGAAVAISQDGSTALVSGWNLFATGVVWVFERSDDGTWSQQDQALTIPGSVTFFGISMALSADGNTALIGAQGDDSMIGSARFFTRLPNKTWIQNGNKFRGSDQNGTSRTGYAVAMDPNATTAFVGGIFDNSFRGAVWVLKNDGQGNWAQSGLKLTPNDDHGGSDTMAFGGALAVSHDTQTLLVGGFNGPSDIGAAWIFTRLANGTYVQAQPKLVPTDATESNTGLGTSVALSSDGSVALIGGPGYLSNIGGAWIFIKQANGKFVQQRKKLVPTGLIGTKDIMIGNAVALSPDGYTALVGSPGDNTFAGSIWVFCRYPNGSWIQRGSKIVAPNAIESAKQGYALSFASSGSTFISGGTGDSRDKGAAWVFNSSTTIFCPGPPAVTQSPTRPPPSPKIQALCIPNYSMSLPNCMRRTKTCNQAGVYMKWTGPGCHYANGRRIGDGGCQCKGYCGYHCQSSCNNDKECTWVGPTIGGACYTKSGIPGSSQTRCWL